MILIMPAPPYTMPRRVAAERLDCRAVAWARVFPTRQRLPRLLTAALLFHARGRRPGAAPEPSPFPCSCALPPARAAVPADRRRRGRRRPGRSRAVCPRRRGTTGTPWSPASARRLERESPCLAAIVDGTAAEDSWNRDQRGPMVGAEVFASTPRALTTCLIRLRLADA